MTKKCHNCDKLKPISDFSKRTRYKDGLEYYCKECSRLKLSGYRKSHHEAFLENCRKYRLKNRDKINDYNRKYYKENGEAKRKKFKERYAENKSFFLLNAKRSRLANPLKIRAQRIANKEISLQGRLCEKCGNQAQDRHHEDYNAPLSIIPLCKSCHLKLHADMRGRLNANTSI